jgi:ABC-2 type transport system ATP-binding protein
MIATRMKLSSNELMPAPAIDVTDLSKDYGPVRAVDDVTFTVEPGELVGFLGPNGAGKSTVMRILTTVLPASRGVARLAGFDVMTDSMDVRRHVGYLPESVPLYGEMRVEEYLAYRAKLKGVDRSVRNRRVEYCLDQFRVREVRRRLLGTLSKGYRQRVGLADALIAEPPILILDEPTSGLDPIQIDETLRSIRELKGKHTVLFSHHILPEVEKVCDRVIIINKGRIRFDDTLSAIAAREPVMVVEVRGPAEPVREFLIHEPGVTGVDAKGGGDGVAAFEVRTVSGKDLREHLTKRLVERNWGVRKVDLRRETLEDTFMKVVVRGG